MNDRTYYDPDDHSAHDEGLQERMERQAELADRLHDEMKDREMGDHFVKSNNKVLEIWVNNPNSSLGWVRKAGPFTSLPKTEKRVKEMIAFDAVRGCKFSIRRVMNTQEKSQ